MIKRRLIQTLLLSSSLLLSGCVSMLAGGMANNLSSAMLNQNDPETVKAGMAAYLLLIDSLITSSPDDADLLMAGSRLYGAYGGTLVSETTRKKRLSNTALNYAERAFCPRRPSICASRTGEFADFTAAATTLNESDSESLYLFATAWAGWIQARTDDWNAIAELPKAEYLLQRLVEIDPTAEAGRAQLYLAVIRSQLPPTLGGKPEQGKHHFELALQYSGGKDLIIKVEYARLYARLIFDQALHDQLLNEVLAANPESPGLTLSNTIAQQQAKSLLEEEYF
ncbi:MAG: TRAP transporter TatT component family protein [Candidatus Polarisedimenticolaceae bacterium]|nr:TRAP transporter TatT component family protein [Candidatus Polarisedimenticolaceae bacterium]